MIGADSAEGLYQAIQEFPRLHYVTWGTYVLFFLVMLGVIAAVREYRRPSDFDWASWVESVAAISLAIGLLDAFRRLVVLPLQAEAYSAATSDISREIVASQRFFLDQWQYIFSLGIGVWIIVVSIVLRASGLIPRSLSIVGIFAGTGSIFRPFESRLVVPLLVEAPDLMTLFGSATWLIWIGVVMYRSQTASRTV